MLLYPFLAHQVERKEESRKKTKKCNHHGYARTYPRQTPPPYSDDISRSPLLVVIVQVHYFYDA